MCAETNTNTKKIQKKVSQKKVNVYRKKNWKLLQPVPSVKITQYPGRYSVSVPLEAEWCPYSTNREILQLLGYYRCNEVGTMKDSPLSGWSETCLLMMTSYLRRVLLIMIIIIVDRKSPAIRCYTDLEITQVWSFVKIIFDYVPKNQGNSVECGMNTGCVKMYKKPYEFSPMGVFIPPHKRGPDLQLFRGNYSYCLL